MCTPSLQLAKADSIMPRMFPKRSDTTVERSEDPSVLYVDNQDTQEIVSVLATDTAYEIFQSLNRQPSTASEIASEMDLSVQNTSYHLHNLEDVGLIEVIDTCYSEKGREMDVYAPTRDPKVVVLGPEDDQATLRRAFSQIAGIIGAPAIVISAWTLVRHFAEQIQET